MQRHIPSSAATARVTVFGESAGAGSIMHVLTAPGIEALVRRAIVQSPGIDFTQTAELSAVVARAFAAAAGATSVDELRALPPARVVEVQTAVAAELLFDVGTMVFHPVVDGDVVPGHAVGRPRRRRGSGVDLLMGYTADEMRLFPIACRRAGRGGPHGLGAVLPDVSDGARSRRGSGPPLAGNYVTAMATTPRSKGSDHWAAISTDGIMRQPVLRVADSRGDAVTFVYQFDWVARRSDVDLGAFHAIELPFVFDAFDAGGWDAFVGVDEGGRKLGRAVRSAWASFAATGDPSGGDLGTWPRYEPAARPTMVLDEGSRVVDDPLATQRSWWASLWDPAARPAGVPQ